MRTELIFTGTELLLGQILNTNAQFLAQRLSALGLDLFYQTVVGDNPGRDVLGAHNAGMQSVWVQRHGRSRDERYPASLECTDLRALVPWLSQQGAS